MIVREFIIYFCNCLHKRWTFLESEFGNVYVGKFVICRYASLSFATFQVHAMLAKNGVIIYKFCLKYYKIMFLAEINVKYNI